MLLVVIVCFLSLATAKFCFLIHSLQNVIISASEKSFLEELEEAGDTMEPVSSGFQLFQSKPTFKNELNLI